MRANLLKLIKVYFAATKTKARVYKALPYVGVAHSLLRYAQAFDKDVHPTGFFAKPCKATQGFRSVRTSTFLT